MNQFRRAIDTCSIFKSAGPGGIRPAHLLKSMEHLLMQLLHVFRAYLELTYIILACRAVRVMFILKPDHIYYETAKTYHSLFIFAKNDKKRIPLHLNQNAYRAAMLMETIYHCLICRLEKNMSSGQVVLGSFIHIKGEINNKTFTETSYDV